MSLVIVKLNSNFFLVMLVKSLRLGEQLANWKASCSDILRLLTDYTFILLQTLESGKYQHVYKKGVILRHVMLVRCTSKIFIRQMTD